MAWLKYTDFNSETGFEAKAGFTLTDKQVEKIEYLVQNPKNLNKAEVGCGKTVMSTVASLMLDYEVTIVAVLPILIDPWVDWLNKVSGNVCMYRGTPGDRKALALGSFRWIVCSHAIYRKDYVKLCQSMYQRNYEVIVDEAQYMKNIESHLFMKVENMVVSGDTGIQMLTGTPVSKPTDAYSYIKIKTPDEYRSYGHFEAIHVSKRDERKNPTEYCNLDVLEQKLSLKSVSATKEELFGYSLKPLFPDSGYHLAPEHQKLYEKLVDEQLLAYDDGTLIDASTSQKLRQALQQVVVNWDHFANDPTKRAAIFDLIDLHMEEIEVDKLDKSKLIIWTKYVRSTEKILNYVNGMGIPAVACYSKADSNRSAELFMKDERVRVLVANPQSAGAGLNPQYVCSEMLYAEIDTVPIYARQALGRIDRMGQTRTPRIRIGKAYGTCQIKLVRQLLEKDDLVSEIEPTKKGLRAMLMGDAG